ncbi:hypothetical protein XM38_032730 [Halomicronema hongdechloris C2206]|uniref:DUF2283 domain-containing protein n=1 Tax=Halomicronema hongdechloris C2206 TaxID=1641165 RepID=A0A1Z3HPY7_9CYAN|nr:DUF2283 domain-containing protein [Halomicronema hongdechloris]ASC72316.1 hypothetical protein XM38_032730 [Halomicronema hongdechloris C2206]
MATYLSRNGVSIRLPKERWQHIVQRHADIAGKQNVVLESDTASMAIANYQAAQPYLRVLPLLQELPKQAFFMVYDAEADVLYIDFANPPHSAVDSELTEDDIVVRYGEDDAVVGLTVLDASKR